LSEFAITGKIDFENLMSERSYNRFKAYQQSKLANILFTFELQRRLKEQGSNITVNAAHPGIGNSFFHTHIHTSSLSFSLFVFSLLLALTFSLIHALTLSLSRTHITKQIQI
jgi:NAD(P)-dependent dehydrogenase (short-subunit alcohol dehydrogenase family)